MKMNELLFIVLSGLAGAVLGTLFFGGLWWTVRKALESPQPALWLAGSLLCRTGIVLAGFYLVGHEDWKRLFACLVGFICGRFVIMRLTRPGVAPAKPPPEDSHATHA
jgi:F1F0 ATPase subunit 2